MIFVDTSAFYALVVADDRNHERAMRTIGRAASEVTATHSYVLSETIALLDARAGRESVVLFKDQVASTLDVIVWVDSEVHDAALAALVGSSPKRGVSFVDLVSFEVMRREGIRRAFAFDRDFARAGFELAR